MEEEEDNAPPEAEVVEKSPRERYLRFKDLIGQGAYKQVWRAYDTIEGIEVAWNVVNLKKMPPAEKARVINEVRLLDRLEHNNIIDFHGSWVNRERGEVVFVTEILSSGSLKRFITKVQVIRWKIVKRWCKQILRALAYLHSQNPPIIHRDIKCDNIFINGTTGDLRIGDLGLSTTAMIERNGKGQSVLGTPEFMAPELYDEEYDEKVDIYAFGMCVVEMITKQLPYAECANPTQIYRKVTANVLPRALDLVPEGPAYEFIQCCVSMDPKRRWSAEQLLQHEFLTNDPEFDETEIRIREQPLPQIPEGAGLSMPPPPPPQLAPAHAPSHDESASGVHPGANTEAFAPPPAQLNVHDDVDAPTTTTTTTVSSSPQPHKQRRLRLKETLRLALMTATDAYVAASQAATGALDAAARALTHARHHGLEEEEDDDEDYDDGDYDDDQLSQEDGSPLRQDSQHAHSHNDNTGVETPEAAPKAEPSAPSTAYFTPIIKNDVDADVPSSDSNQISSSPAASDCNGGSPVVEQRSLYKGPADASTDVVDEHSLALHGPTGPGSNSSYHHTLVTEESKTSSEFSPPYTQDSQLHKPDTVVAPGETPGPVGEPAILSEKADVSKPMEASNSETVTRSAVMQSRSDQPGPANADDENRSEQSDALTPPSSATILRGSRTAHLDDIPESKRDFDSEEYFNSMENAEKLENKKRIRVLEGREKRRADDDSDFPVGSQRPPAAAAVAPNTVPVPRPVVQQRTSPSSVHEFQPPPMGRAVTHAPNALPLPTPHLSDKSGPDQAKNGVVPAHSSRHQSEASPVTLGGHSGRPPIAAIQASGTKTQPAPAPGMARPPLPLQQRTSSTGMPTTAPVRGQSQRAQSPGPNGGPEPQHSRPPMPVAQRAPSPGPTGHRSHQANDNKDVGVKVSTQANGAADHRRVRADSEGPPPAQQKPRLRPSSAPSSRYSTHRRQDEDVNDSAPSTPSRSRGHSSKHYHADPPTAPSPETPPHGKRSSSSIGMPPIMSPNDSGNWERHPLQRLGQSGDSARHQETNDQHRSSQAAPTAMNEATQAVANVHDPRANSMSQPRVRPSIVPLSYGQPTLSVSDGTLTHPTQVFEADAVPRQDVERERSDDRRSDNGRQQSEYYGLLGSFDDDYESIDSQIISEPVGDDLVKLSFPYSFDGVLQRVSFEYNLCEDPRDIADEFAKEMGYPPEEMRPFAAFLANVRHRNRALKRTPKLGPDSARDMPSQAPASGHPFSTSTSGSSVFPLGLLPPGNAYLASLSDRNSDASVATITQHPVTDQDGADFRGRLVAHRDDDVESLRISAAESATEALDAPGFLNDEIANRLSTLGEFLDTVDVYIDEEDEEEQRRLTEEYKIMRMRVKNIHEDRLDKLQHSRQDCVQSHEQAAAKFEEQMRNLGRKERDITTSKEAIRSDHERVMKKYEKDMQDYDRKFRIEHAAYSKRLHDFDQEYRQRQDEVRRRVRARQLQQQQLCRENSQSSSVSSDHHHTPAPSMTTTALPVQPTLSATQSNVSR